MTIYYSGQEHVWERNRMHPLSNKWVGHVHLPHGHDFVPWIGHLIENEHFWTVLAWVILILTFAFFATVPAY